MRPIDIFLQNKYAITLTSGFLLISYPLISEIARRVIPLSTHRRAALQAIITASTCGIFALLSKSESKVIRIALFVSYVVCGVYACFGKRSSTATSNSSNSEQNQVPSTTVNDQQFGAPRIHFVEEWTDKDHFLRSINNKNPQQDPAPNNVQKNIERVQEQRFNFSGQTLTTISEEMVGYWIHATVLDINNNFLPELPNSIGHLSSLRLLDLNYNNLTTLPNSIGGLSFLRILCLECNELTTLPNSIGNLSSLCELNLKNNKLTTLPNSIESLQKLRLLYLDDNKLTTLPGGIGNLKSLEYLYLDHNRLTTLPNSIGNLENLKQLDFRDNRLTTLPDSIGNLKRLEQLLVSGNQLTTFPNTIGNLSSLRVFEFSNNQFAMLPDSIENLRELRYFHVNNNQLTMLPNSIGNLTELIELHFDNNQLTTLPDSIENLKVLEKLVLNNNRLTMLPNSIGNLSSLRVFHLNNNQLTTLPNSIENLRVLEKLFLSNNQLTTLPDSIGNLRELERLRLNRNRFTAIPECLLRLPSDCEINMEDNWFSEEYILQFNQRLRNLPEAPRFFLSVESYNNLQGENQEDSLETAVTWWTKQYQTLFPSKKVEITWTQLKIKDIKEESLLLFLNKLKGMKEYQKNTSLVVQTVYDMLYLFTTHPEFRRAVYTLLILESLENCHDRPAFYFPKIRTFIKYYSHEGPWEENELIKFLLGIHRSALVQQECDKFLEKNRHKTDHLEVHLYVQMKLGKEFGFDFSENMIFPDIGRVSDKELNDIREDVLKQTQTPEQITNILLNGDKLWKDRFKKQTEDVLEKIKDNLHEDLEKLCEYAEIANALEALFPESEKDFTKLSNIEMTEKLTQISPMKMEELKKVYNDGFITEKLRKALKMEEKERKNFYHLHKQQKLTTKAIQDAGEEMSKIIKAKELEFLRTCTSEKVSQYLDPKKT